MRRRGLGREVEGVFVAEVLDYLGWEDLGSGTYTMSTEERLVGLQPTAESFRTDTRSAGKFGFSTGFHGYWELGILN